MGAVNFGGFDHVINGRYIPPPTATDLASANATELRVRLGRIDLGDGMGIPYGVAYASVETYVVTGLHEHNWPLTKASLRVAQWRAEQEEKAAAERLWTEENA